MGRIARELGEGVTRYYWYPGHKTDWIKSAIALGAGIALFVLTYVVFKNSLVAAVVGSSVTCGIGGSHLGRRDVGALREFHDMTGQRRAAVRDSGRAAWRGTIQGFTCAASAVFVMNMSATGFLADWVLPIVPSVVGALAHTAGMVFERLAQMTQENTAAEQQRQSEEDTKTTKLEPARSHA